MTDKREVSENAFIPSSVGVETRRLYCVFCGALSDWCAALPFTAQEAMRIRCCDECTHGRATPQFDVEKVAERIAREYERRGIWPHDGSGHEIYADLKRAAERVIADELTKIINGGE